MAPTAARRVSTGERINVHEKPGQLQKQLAARSIRLTRQRRVVLQVMDTAPRHLDAGEILARAFIGGELHREMMDLGDDEMVAAVRDEFRALLGVTAVPGIAVVRRWRDAMPQYDVGHLARVAEIERLIAPIPAFAVAGAAYRGVGSPDCVRSGEAAADAIFAKLSTPK